MAAKQKQTLRTTDDDRLESSPTDLTNESSHFDTLLPSHMIPHSSSTSLDIAGSNEVSDTANSSAMILFHHVKTAFQQLHLVMKLGLSILNGLINIPGSKEMQHFAMSVISSQQVHMVKSRLLELGVRTGCMHLVKVEN